MPSWPGLMNRHPDIVRMDLRRELEQTLDERVARYIEVDHQWVVPQSHFAEASQEAVELYRDGHFISCIMVTQAINEAIIRLILKANNLTRMQGEKIPDLATRCQTLGLITNDCATAIMSIWGSFRNDFHHMLEPVAGLDFQTLAKRNVVDLSRIEGEIFECGRDARGLVPKHRQYWKFDGKKVAVFLRNS